MPLDDLKEKSLKLSFPTFCRKLPVRGINTLHLSFSFELLGGFAIFCSSCLHPPKHGLTSISLSVFPGLFASILFSLSHLDSYYHTICLNQGLLTLAQPTFWVDNSRGGGCLRLYDV